MATTNDGKQQRNTDDAAQTNVSTQGSGGPSTHDADSRLGASTANDRPPSQQVPSHLVQSPSGSTLPDHGSSSQTGSSSPASNSHSLGHYVSQQQTPGRYALEVWGAESQKAGHFSPFQAVSSLHNANDRDYHVADGEKEKCGSDTGATWGGSVNQDDH